MTTQVPAVRPNMPTMPDRIASLPTDPDRGYPVPWFVIWINGKPEFRVADSGKRVRAVRDKLCWVCGQQLGRYLSFVIGPMCSVNRISADPPSHLECAEFSVRACPFLSKPKMVRREGGLPEGCTHDGEPIMRNPGATLIWTTRGYRVVPDGKGGFVFRLDDPTSWSWWAEGRTATREEVVASMESGLPILRGMAEEQGPEAIAALAKMYESAQRYLPA